MVSCVKHDWQNPKYMQLPAPSNGWCLNPKRLLCGTLYYPFGTPKQGSYMNCRIIFQPRSFLLKKGPLLEDSPNYAKQFGGGVSHRKSLQFTHNFIDSTYRCKQMMILKYSWFLIFKITGVCRFTFSRIMLQWIFTILIH